MKDRAIKGLTIENRTISRTIATKEMILSKDSITRDKTTDFKINIAKIPRRI